MPLYILIWLNEWMRIFYIIKGKCRINIDYFFLIFFKCITYIHIRTFWRGDSLSDCAYCSHTSLHLFVNSRPLSLRHPLRTKNSSGDRVQQPPAVGKMRVAGDVLVRRPRGGQRQDHPPCRCPGSVYARRRGYFPRAREWSWDTAGTELSSCRTWIFGENYYLLIAIIFMRNNHKLKKCVSLIFYMLKRCWHERFSFFLFANMLIIGDLRRLYLIFILDANQWIVCVFL